MFSNRLAVAVLGVACITAAAGGGYFAARQNAVPTPAAAQGQTAEAPLTPVADASASRPVQETEALVGDAVKSAPAPAPVAAPPPFASRSSRRAEAPPPPAPTTRRATASAPARNRTSAARNDPPPLSSTWPSSASSQSPSSASSTPDSNASSLTEDRTAQEPIRSPEPPQKTFEELVVSADSVIGLQTENRISSETARVEDRVEARVTRDVKVSDHVAIPAGSRAIGSVMQVERGGKFKEKARLGIRFHTLVLADGT